MTNNKLMHNRAFPQNGTYNKKKQNLRQNNLKKLHQPLDIRHMSDELLEHEEEFLYVHVPRENVICV
jgi:hypothetical protein